MYETLVALVLAHVLADFVFQTNWMAEHKMHPLALALHLMTVAGTAMLTLGSANPMLFLLAAVHLAIDLVKAVQPYRGIWPFLVDQILHLAVLVVVAVKLPDLWGSGLWAFTPEDGGMFDFGEDAVNPLPAYFALATGFLVATRAGGFAVGLLMEPWASAVQGGLPGGGRLIGNLERAMVFVLILTGQSGSIGFLIAAKSVLRFSSVKDERKFSEYVIIGTLSSFFLAIVAALATIIVLRLFPPIGIPDLAP